MSGDEFFELRNYAVERGRIADMRARVRNHLVPLFATHGIDVVQYWDGGTAAQPVFVYLVRWADWATRTRNWNAFYADPQWHQARASTNAGSELVESVENMLLRRFHAEPGVAACKQRLLLSLKVAVSRTGDAQRLLCEQIIPEARRQGVIICEAYEVAIGSGLPQLLVTATGSSPLQVIEKLLIPPLVDVKLWDVSGQPYSGEEI